MRLPSCPLSCVQSSFKVDHALDQLEHSVSSLWASDYKVRYSCSKALKQLAYIHVFASACILLQLHVGWGLMRCERKHIQANTQFNWWITFILLTCPCFLIILSSQLCTISLPQTPLLVAAKKGSLDCVKLLLYHGANINHSVKIKLKHQYASYFAKRSGFSALEQYLKKCQSKCRDDSKVSECHVGDCQEWYSFISMLVAWHSQYDAIIMVIIAFHLALYKCFEGNSYQLWKLPILQMISTSWTPPEHSWSWVSCNYYIWIQLSTMWLHDTPNMNLICYNYSQKACIY